MGGLGSLGLIVLLAASVVVPAAEAAVVTSPYQMGDWEKQYRLYLEADSGSGGPFLSEREDASSTSAYTVTTPGATELAGTLGGAMPAPITFTLRGQVPADRWLNLSKPVVGALYWQSQLAAPSSHETAYVQVMVYLGDRLVGGDYYAYAPGTAYKPWMPMFFKFRPEVSMLEKGGVLSIKIIRTGLADFVVGTSGSQQSYLEFRYFDADPLAGGVYLENDLLYRAGGPSPDATGLLIGVPFLLLAAPIGGRRSRVAALAVLVVLGAGLSGCIQGATKTDSLAGTGDPDAPQATAETEHEQDEELRKLGHGAVEGIVLDGETGNIPVRTAHVAMLGTSLFTQTDRDGRYAFDNVSAGAYVMRIDAQGFTPLETAVEVQTGQRVWVNVTLVRPGTGATDNGKAHLHDMWGGESVKTLFEVAFKPNSYLYEVPNAYVAPYFCCESPIPLPESIQILPGTSLVEITLSWSGANTPKEWGLRIVTAGNTSADQIFIARGSGVAFRIPIFPNEADPGHQRGTDWQLFLRSPPQTSSTYHPWGPPAYVGDRVSVRGVIHKGVVPYEPQHRTFWNGRDELPLVNDATVTPSLICCSPPYYPGHVLWRPGKGAFVPPGTKEIKGTLTWSGQQGAPAGIPWKLVYKGANDAANSDLWHPAQMGASSPTTTSATFTIPVSADQADQYYQQTSRWRFAADDDVPKEVRPYSVVNEGQSVHFSLTATAVKDPAYTEG
jgi:hypothetical protein